MYVFPYEIWINVWESWQKIKPSEKTKYNSKPKDISVHEQAELNIVQVICIYTFILKGNNTSYKHMD